MKLMFKSQVFYNPNFTRIKSITTYEYNKNKIGSKYSSF